MLAKSSNLLVTAREQAHPHPQARKKHNFPRRFSQFDVQDHLPEKLTWKSFAHLPLPTDVWPSKSVNEIPASPVKHTCPNKCCNKMRPCNLCRAMVLRGAMLQNAFTCHDMSCDGMARHDVSWHAMPCHGMTCCDTLWHVTSCRHMTYRRMSCFAKMCRTMAWLNMSCHAIARSIMVSHGIICHAMTW